MPRGVAWWATLMVAAAPACLLVAGLLAPRDGSSAGPVLPKASSPLASTGLPAVAAGSTATADEPPPHPVVIRHPGTLGVLDTELSDVRGTTCHAAGAGPPIAARDGAPEDFHAGVQLSHGTLSCNSCHDPADRTQLRLADGTPLALAEVMQLCGQCHGPQIRDYERGSHGGMAGYWDLARGPRVRNSCVACHAAHEPAYPKVVPAAPPRDRFLPQHPAPRPAHRLPGRDSHGATPHDRS
jgi:hypothetical protein